MGFRVHNLGLNEAIAESVRQIGKRLYDGPAPSALYHYTAAERVVSIVNGRCVWATSLADQSDQSELLHAIEIVRVSSESIIGAGKAQRNADVLRAIAPSMEERRNWFFIACFCGNEDSHHHQKTYGNCCLRFEAPWMKRPHLTLVGSHVDCWYQRVIYDPSIQSDAITEALHAIADALDRNTSGFNEGPWQPFMTSGCARIAAHHLLAIALGFKRKEFIDDGEWRIVCCPRLNPLSSAPSMADENFRVAIKLGVRRHVELTVPREYRLFEPLLIPPVPFVQVIPNMDAYTGAEFEKVRRALRENGREDLFPDASDKT